MFETLALLGRTMGFSFAAGINLYATVAILGLAERFGWVDLRDASPAVKGLAALLGGTLATGTHLTKAGTRAAANASPEPFSNWALSLGEDLFVLGLSALALKYPIAAAVVVILGVAVMASFAAWIVKAVRRRWGTRPPPVGPNLSSVV
jgi:hypothetical protein